MIRMIIIMIAAFVVVAVLFGTIQVRLEKGIKDPEKLKKKCTARTTGTIKEVKNLYEFKHVTVEYFVNDQKYLIGEDIKQYKVVNPDASKRRDKVKFRDYITCRTGHVIDVMYNPRRPQMAYLPDNVGEREDVIKGSAADKAEEGAGAADN